MEYVICKYGGVFLSGKALSGRSLKNVGRAVVVWSLSIVIFTLLASIIVSSIKINEKTLNGISSLITFMSSAAAGISLRKSRESKRYCFLLCLLIIIAALSVGLLLDGSRLEPGGVLSVSSFTICGTMSGYVIKTRGRKRSRIKI